MRFKVQHFFHVKSRLPLVQESITSTKYLVINSIGNSSMYTFVTKFLIVDFEVTLYNSALYFGHCIIFAVWVKANADLKFYSQTGGASDQYY